MGWKDTRQNFFFVGPRDKVMPFRCGGLTKHNTKCRICVKDQSDKCRWHSGSLGTCSICFDEVSRGSEKKLEGCSHVFHSECILPWFVRCGESGDGSLTCPNCRAVVDDRPTILWVGEHSSSSEDDDDWVQRRVWRRLARVASEQRITARRGLLEHIRGLFDRISGHVSDNDD